MGVRVRVRARARARARATVGVVVGVVLIERTTIYRLYSANPFSPRPLL